MSPPNGHANGSGTDHPDPRQSALPATMLTRDNGSHFTPEQIRQSVAQLEVPFDPGVIEWRVTNTSKQNRSLRGQVVPYADQRAYTDRLNALFTPTGWTRKYTVHTSANFQRSKDQSIIAKVFVTCDLTIFGLGSHAATGEEWTDSDNAVTSAEAQSFKRAAACFGLGRYLYYFRGTWVDLDDKKRPKTTPKLAGWATPEGWQQGLRPRQATDRNSLQSSGSAKHTNISHGQQNENDQGGRFELIRQIEAMAEPLGRGLYRGLLKAVALAWKPGDIKEVAVLERLLTHMQAADRGLHRMGVALDMTGSEALVEILGSLGLRSLEEVDSLETLHRIVLSIEAKAGIVSSQH